MGSPNLSGAEQKVLVLECWVSRGLHGSQLRLINHGEPHRNRAQGSHGVPPSLAHQGAPRLDHGRSCWEPEEKRLLGIHQPKAREADGVCVHLRELRAAELPAPPDRRQPPCHRSLHLYGAVELSVEGHAVWERHLLGAAAGLHRVGVGSLHRGQRALQVCRGDGGGALFKAVRREQVVQLSDPHVRLFFRTGAENEGGGGRCLPEREAVPPGPVEVGLAGCADSRVDHARFARGLARRLCL
mmetsp:Transcript_45850/g.109444  ORF Transcript_45850/g.109444 Transcript_45850/m.109444 type:complete len:242 (-) Transcript_45850:1361-2086(-)